MKLHRNFYSTTSVGIQLLGLLGFERTWASSSYELAVAIFIHLKKLKFLYGSAVVVVVGLYPTYICT